MKNILSAEELPVLDRLERERTLLVFDFDGTLAPIVSDRDAAQLTPQTRSLLRALSLLHPCAVLSGRARADVARRLQGIPLLAVVGNHGAEAGHGPIDQTRRGRVLEWKELLARAVGSQQGVDIEDKRFSLAVHYRHARSPLRTRTAILRAVSGLAGARVFGGRAVVNVVPEGAPDKGSALEELAARVCAKLVMYVGDDRTDEHAFQSPRVSVSVRVGRTRRSSAEYYVPGQCAVDDLLRALIAARARRHGNVRWEGLVRAVGT